VSGGQPWESNPEEIEAQETRMNTGFSTFGRIAGRPLVLRSEVVHPLRYFAE
jgi:hypothetical protein